jgi:hypothetical protein
MRLRLKAPTIRRHPRARSVRAVTAAGFAVLLGAAALGAVGPAQALDPAGVGPSDARQSGFPAYYTDDSGVALQLCVDGSAACGGATLRSDGAGGPGVNVAPDGEGFWYMATTSLSAPGLDLDIELAAEAAWLSPTQPISFDRLRIRGHSDTAGDIVVTTPYGATTVTAGDPANPRNVNFTDDVGCDPLPRCNFTTMASSPNGHITSWITSTTPPPGRVGDGVTSEPATMGGVPATASAGGASTNNWVVMGKLANPRAVSVPTFVDFGNTRTARTRTVRMVNLGTQPLTLGATSLRGSRSITQLAGSTCTAGRTVNPGGGCQVTLRYRPGRAKSAAAVLRIRDTGRVHVVRVKAGSSAVASVRNAFRFRSVRAGAAGRTRRVVVRNTGALPLRIRGVRVAGANAGSFRIRPGAPRVCRRGTQVPTGGQCGVYLRFEPKSFGPKQAALFLRTNGLPALQTVRLSGAGR